MRIVQTSGEFIAVWLIRWLIIIGAWRQAGRGIDYLTGDWHQAGIIEVGSQISTTVWGICCCIVSVFRIVALFLDRGRVQITACLAAFCVNAGFTVVAGTEVFEWTRLSQAQGSFSMLLHWVARTLGDATMLIPVDDWRFMNDYFTSAAQWVVIALAIVMLEAVRDDRRKVAHDAA